MPPTRARDRAWRCKVTGIRFARIATARRDVMRGFLLGAIVGAAAMWVWGGELRSRFGDSIDGVVDRALGVLDAIDDRLEMLRERLDSLKMNEPGNERRERWDTPLAGGPA
jgi:hypothetical protein